MLKVVLDDKIPYVKGVLEAYGIACTYLPGKAIDAQSVRDADALIVRTRTRCNEALLSGSRVRLVASATIGFDHLDTAWLEKNGIAWCNAPGCNAASVAQYMTSLLLALAVRNHWRLREKTLGIIGIGNVGRKVALVAEALGMKVLKNDPPRARKEGPGDFVGLPELLKYSDVVTFHVPLSFEGIDRTCHLADEAMLASMRPDQILINASRGEVADNIAWKAALGKHQIAGAVLDVWENEPEIDRELQKLLLYGTPHIAGYSYDGKANGSAMSINALARFFALDDALQTWYPATVPLPDDRQLFCEGKTLEEELWSVVRRSYDIASDSAALTRDPDRFEALRGNYPLRREFGAYFVTGGSSQAREILEKLGFQLQ